MSDCADRHQVDDVRLCEDRHQVDRCLTMQGQASGGQRDVRLCRQASGRWRDVRLCKDKCQVDGRDFFLVVVEVVGAHFP